jgi:ERCC4 domain
MNSTDPGELLIALNPNRNSKLPFLLLVPYGDGLVLASAGRWPGSRSLYCAQLPPTRWPRSPELVDHAPVLRCEKRGFVIDLVLDRGRNNRSQLVFSSCRGREMVFWQSGRSSTQYRPKTLQSTGSGAGPARLEIFVDTREQEAYTFDYQRVCCVRCKLACGDYAVAVEGRLVAAVERKSLPDLAASIRSRRLEYAMAELAALPRAAVVVEDRYSQVYEVEYLRAARLADRLSDLQVAFPNVPIIFPGTRGLAQEWTYRFLESASRWSVTEQAGLERVPAKRRERSRPKALRSSEERAVRCWARTVGLAVGENEAVRPGLWEAWRRERNVI